MVKRYAVIYIGSNQCELVVGQRGKKGVNILDRAMYPIDIGSQTFATGTIAYPTVITLSKIINDYISIAKSSDAQKIDIVGTSALREAKNRIYVLEQIRIFTGGYQVRLLARDDEISLAYCYMAFKSGGSLPREKGCEVLSIFSSGNITMALAQDGLITRMRHADMGYLKIRAMFREIEERSTHYETLISEYISIRSRAINALIGDNDIAGMTILSQNANVIAHLFGIDISDDGCYHATRRSFLKLHENVESLGTSQIMKKYPRLTMFEAETLRHTLSAYLQIMDSAGVNELAIMQMNTADALMQFNFNIQEYKKLRKWIDESTLASVKELAKKFYCDTAHTDAVEWISIRLFNALKSKYQMDKQDERYLRCAAQLIDVGQFVGESNLAATTQQLIESSDILGLTKQDKCIVGTIVRKVREYPFDETTFDSRLTPDECLRVAKLTSILMLGKALDKSRRQKISKLRCHLDEKEFVITATTNQNIQLEHHFLRLNRQAMRRVFGINARLKVKRVAL